VYVFYGAFTMSGGDIAGNSAGVGGGVFVFSGGAFTKSGGGTIGGNKAESGKAAYVSRSSARKRDSDAGPGVDMNSGKSGGAGGWEFGVRDWETEVQG
jgi:hypothetical protein